MSFKIKAVEGEDNMNFNDFAISKPLTIPEDGITTVTFTVIINGNKFIGTCHHYDCKKSDIIVITNDHKSNITNLNICMDNVNIGRYPGFFEKNYGVSDELLRDTIISKVKAFLRGEDPNEF